LFYFVLNQFFFLASFTFIKQQKQQKQLEKQYRKDLASAVFRFEGLLAALSNAPPVNGLEQRHRGSLGRTRAKE